MSESVTLAKAFDKENVLIVFNYRTRVRTNNVNKFLQGTRTPTLCAPFYFYRTLTCADVNQYYAPQTPAWCGGVVKN